MPRKLLLILTMSLLTTASTAAEPATKYVLLLGQKPDGHPPATHEYLPGVKIIAALLAKTPHISAQVESADEPWSAGPELLRKADGAVLFLSQGAAWLSNDPRRLDAFTGLAQRGGGLVVIHWGMGTKEAAPIEPWLRLFGGCHGGPDRRYQKLDTALRPVSSAHPITRGIAELPLHEEFYYALKFAKSETPVTPVVVADIDGRAETVGWAWTRPDGGRSFGFSGLHYHSNWQHEAYRRLITQGILWTLKIDIPEKGVDVPIDPKLLELAPAAQ